MSTVSRLRSVSVLGSSDVTPQVGPVTDNGDGTYTFELIDPGVPGTARLRVEVDVPSLGTVVLAPPPQVVF